MNYTATAAGTAKKIKAAGKAITLNRPTGGTVNPGTGSLTGAINTTYSGYAVEIQFDQYLVANGVVENDMKRLLVVGVPSPIVGKDTLTVDGSTWQILKVLPLQPASVTLLWEVWVQ